MFPATRIFFSDKDKICTLTGNIYCHNKYLQQQGIFSSDNDEIFPVTGNI